MSQQASNKFLLVLGMSSLIPGLIYLEEKLIKIKMIRLKEQEDFIFVLWPYLLQFVIT